MNAYFISLIVAIVAMLIAIMASNSVAWDPSPRATDKATRRTWFWVMGALVPVVSWAICFFVVYQAARGRARKSDAMMATCIASAVAFVLYVGAGWILSKICNKKKIGTWF